MEFLERFGRVLTMNESWYVQKRLFKNYFLLLHTNRNIAFQFKEQRKIPTVFMSQFRRRNGHNEWNWKRKRERERNGEKRQKDKERERELVRELKR